MPENYLHIWPRGKFMMIALPNQDKSWTVTLFMPFENFKKLSTDFELLKFFEEHFPDVIPLIGRDRLVTDFFKLEPQYLIAIKVNTYLNCFYYFYINRSFNTISVSTISFE